MDPVSVGLGVLQLGSSLFGGSSTPKAPQYAKDMFFRGNSLVKQAEGFNPQVDRRRNDLLDLRDERDREVGRGWASVQSKIGGPPEIDGRRSGGKFLSDVVEQNKMRTMALTRVAQSGDAAVEQQGLRDRLSLSERALNSARIAQGMGSEQSRLDAWRRDRNAEHSANRNEIIGYGVGNIGTQLYDMWKNRG